MRFVSVLICDLPVGSERERRLKSLLMNNARTPWVASIRYREARTIQKPHYPKLVLLDLDPTPERGLEVISQVKNQVEYILVTGSHPSEHLVLQALHLGATEFLLGENLEAELEQASARIVASRSKTNNFMRIGLLRSGWPFWTVFHSFESIWTLFELGALAALLFVCLGLMWQFHSLCKASGYPLKEEPSKRAMTKWKPHEIPIPPSSCRTHK